MNTNSSITLLFEDSYLIAIDKPAGLLVHRTALAKDRDVLQYRIRDHIGQFVYPVHRLDRPTSGVVLFAKQPETAAKMQQQFMQNTIAKTYLAVVRGWPENSGLIDHPVSESKDHPLQAAQTMFQTSHRFELPIANSRFSSSRYAILNVYPKTGRYHQIRKHMAHISHPIIGDVRHGSGEHNRIFREHLDLYAMMLRASQLKLLHPETGEELCIAAPPNEIFKSIIALAEQ